MPTLVVETCATLIPDPVLRLRFLRHTMVVPTLPRALRQPPARRWYSVLVLATLLVLTAGSVSDPTPLPRPERQPPSAGLVPRVWLVERTADSELYSNGLRIENRFACPGKPRLYRILARAAADDRSWRWRTDPAGIVFHGSESDIVPFEPEQNGVLKEQGLGLLAYASRHQAYHFLIDRFGRVHRLVEETAKADHAGRSIWADANWIYLNLNTSFLGICFEAQTQPGTPVSPAQLHAGKVLVEMLRARYGIAAGNCVTHAQVSVNPHNFLVGYHTDWAKGFPFAEVGLPDNYEQPLPSLLLFGFEADSSFVELSGMGLRGALSQAEQQVEQAAAIRRISVARYRADLKKRYAAIAAAAGDPATR